MPVIKSAKKKLRQDKKRQKQNRGVKDTMKKAIKKARTNPSEETLKSAFKSTDKAAKVNVIHKNKAARIKSVLSQLLSSSKNKKATVK